MALESRRRNVKPVRVPSSDGNDEMAFWFRPRYSKPVRTPMSVGTAS